MLWRFTVFRIVAQLSVKEKSVQPVRFLSLLRKSFVAHAYAAEG